MAGVIVVISGPSGCGKSSLVSKILEKYDDIYFSISTTTRAMREGEAEGVNYHYISKEEFKSEIDEGMFLEWAEVHGNYYGTSLRPVEKALRDGKLVIFDIDVQGHAIVKERYANIMTSLFITTPDQATLRARLEGRGTDSQEVIESRLVNAKEEMDRIEEYEYLLVNDDLEIASQKFDAILKVARLKQSKAQIESFRARW